MNVQRRRLIADGFAGGLIGYALVVRYLTASHRGLARTIQDTQETRLGRVE